MAKGAEGSGVDGESNVCRGGPGGGALARGWCWGCGGDFCGAERGLLALDCRIAKIVTARGGVGALANLLCPDRPTGGLAKTFVNADLLDE